MSQANAKFPAPCSFPHKTGFLQFWLDSPRKWYSLLVAFSKPWKTKQLEWAEWDWNVYLTYIYMSTVGIALKRWKKMSKRSISDALVCGSSLIRTFKKKATFEHQRKTSYRSKERSLSWGYRFFLWTLLLLRFTALTWGCWQQNVFTLGNKVYYIELSSWY